MNKLHFKVGLFAAASLLLAGVFIVYLLHARGFFEKTFHLQLAAASCRWKVFSKKPRACSR